MVPDPADELTDAAWINEALGALIAFSEQTRLNKLLPSYLER